MQHHPAKESVPFPRRLADECRRLASQEKDSPRAVIFEKLARLFEETTAAFLSENGV